MARHNTQIVMDLDQYLLRPLPVFDIAYTPLLNCSPHNNIFLLKMVGSNSGGKQANFSARFNEMAHLFITFLPTVVTGEEGTYLPTYIVFTPHVEGKVLPLRYETC